MGVAVAGRSRRGSPPSDLLIAGAGVLVEGGLAAAGLHAGGGYSVDAGGGAAGPVEGDLEVGSGDWPVCGFDAGSGLAVRGAAAAFAADPGLADVVGVGAAGVDV